MQRVFICFYVLFLTKDIGWKCRASLVSRKESRRGMATGKNRRALAITILVHIHRVILRRLLLRRYLYRWYRVQKRTMRTYRYYYYYFLVKSFKNSLTFWHKRNRGRLDWMEWMFGDVRQRRTISVADVCVGRGNERCADDAVRKCSSRVERV